MVLLAKMDLYYRYTRSPYPDLVIISQAQRRLSDLLEKLCGFARNQSVQGCVTRI